MHRPAAASETVIIVEDDPLLRAATDSLLRSVGLATMGFDDPQEALTVAWPDGPRCIVSDIRLPRMSGLEFQRRLTERGDATPLIFMTGHGDIPMSVAAMKAGAADFLTKPYRDQDMLDAVAKAMALDRDRREQQARQTRTRVAYEQLTAREREVLAGVARGLLNKQIAGELGLAEITVKLHRSSMMKKLGLRTVPELVRVSDMLADDHTRG